MSATRGYDPPRIYLGAVQEDPVRLSRQDWRGPRAGWRAGDLGHWQVKVARPGTYDVTLLFAPAAAARKVHFKLGAVSRSAEAKAKAERYTFAGLTLPEGPGQLEAWVGSAGKRVGVRYVVVRRREK